MGQKHATKFHAYKNNTRMENNEAKKHADTKIYKPKNVWQSCGNMKIILEQKNQTKNVLKNNHR